MGMWRHVCFGCVFLAIAGCATNHKPAPVLVHHLSPRGHASKAPPPLNPFKIKVVTGDTVYGLARHYRLPIAAIIRENNLKAPYTLKGGQVIKMPKPRLHTVKKGETVFTLAQAYDLDLQDLIRDNQMTKPYTLRVGQRVRVPEPILPPTGGKRPKPIAEKPQDKKQEIQSPKPAVDQPVPPKVPEDSSEDTPEISDAVTIPLDTPAPAKPQEIVHAAPKFVGRQGQFRKPVSGSFLSTYGPQGQGKHNDGVNVSAATGTPVVATADGKVVYVGNEMKGFGNLILLKHDNGWTSAYGHLDTMTVKKGQTVQGGQPIGTVGSTGHVTKPQLHFELRKKARTVNPLSYVKF